MSWHGNGSNNTAKYCVRIMITRLFCNAILAFTTTQKQRNSCHATAFQFPVKKQEGPNEPQNKTTIFAYTMHYGGRVLNGKYPN